MHDCDEHSYMLEPERPKRGPAPPTIPGTQPGSTGNVLLDASINRHRASRAIQSADSAVVRHAYMTPIVMLVIGLTVTSLLLAAQHGLIVVPFYVLSYAIVVPIGVGVFLVCCALWIGFDAPVHLIALQLAGIYAVTDIAWVLLDFVPYGGLFLWIVPAAIYIALLAALLDIEVVEAVVVGLLTYAVKIIGVLVLSALI
jgi:hypothetical protein